MTPDQQKDRERLRRYIEREQLTSVMSDAKWRRLRDSLLALPFPVRFRRRDVRDAGPVDPRQRWDPDEAHALGEAASIEWLELSARREIPRGQLVAPLVEDETLALRRALLTARVPFSVVGGNVRVWGYIRPRESPQWETAEEPAAAADRRRGRVE